MATDFISGKLSERLRILGLMIEKTRTGERTRMRPVIAP
jgi:hypothetical protein